MNLEAIKKKLQVYYDSVTPEQVVADFEAMGVELEDIDESIPMTLVIGNEELTSAMYTYTHLKWLDVILVATAFEKSEIEDISIENLLASNYQYAMAA
ncbi:MAG: hypothetical protein IPN76_02000 [Saprospiraceae bacterium]|jgi:hypothetical protein|nr:hypothetical protein [Saprospiraceae bacterium]